MKTSNLILLILCFNLTSLPAQINLKSLKNKALNRTPDQGITSPTHKANVGKIVFSKDRDAISFKNEDPSRFSHSFNASEPIYARLYLAKSLANTQHGLQKNYNSTLMFELYIDGEKIEHKKSFGLWQTIPEDKRTFYTEDVTGDQYSKWTSWRPYFLPKLDDPQLKYGNVNIAARSFVLALLDQEVGTHEIEMKMYSRGDKASSKVLVSGKFTLKMTEADKRNLAFRYAPPLPKDEWRGGNKEALLKEVAAAFEQEIRKKPILVGLYGMDWQVGTYTLTGQKYRKTAAWAIFDDTDEDGQVPITTFNWVSDYAGGSWTKMRFDSHCNGCPDWDVEVAAVRAMAGK